MKAKHFYTAQTYAGIVYFNLSKRNVETLDRESLFEECIYLLKPKWTSHMGVLDILKFASSRANDVSDMSSIATLQIK
jgi:hypothetical protein